MANSRFQTCLLLCVAASVVTVSTADTPYVYDQFLSEENKPVLSLLPPFQYAPSSFRSEANDNSLESTNYPLTFEDSHSNIAQLDTAVKQSSSLPASFNLLSNTELNDINSEPQRIEGTYAFLTPHSLPIYQYSNFRSAPNGEVRHSDVELRIESPDRPIAVVPFKPPKRRPNKFVPKSPVSPPQPESPMALPTQNLSPSSTPLPVQLAPYSVWSIRNPKQSAPYSAASAPYSAALAPYPAAPAPYHAPAAPYSAASAPYSPAPAPYSAASLSISSFLGRVKGMEAYAPYFSNYQADLEYSEGDTRSGSFPGNSDTQVPQPTLIFARVHGRSLFDTGRATEHLSLDSGSYSYLSPENVPVYMLEVSRRE